MKILIAEDNDDNFMVVKSNLKKLENIELKWAKNGQEAFDLICEGYEPDLFLIDIEMPVMKGDEFIRLIKNDKKFDQTPIIVMTASIFAEMKENYYKIGANDILEKPFSRADLLALIDTYVKR